METLSTNILYTTARVLTLCQDDQLCCQSKWQGLASLFPIHYTLYYRHQASSSVFLTINKELIYIYLLYHKLTNSRLQPFFNRLIFYHRDQLIKFKSLHVIYIPLTSLLKFDKRSLFIFSYHDILVQKVLLKAVCYKRQHSINDTYFELYVTGISWGLGGGGIPYYN